MLHLVMTATLMGQIYLAELTVYDPAIPGTTVLRYTDAAGYNDAAAPGYYEGRVAAVSLFKAELSADPRRAGPTVAAGSIVLKNHDRGLDAQILRSGLAGHPFTLRVGEERAGYGSFAAVMTGKMIEPVFADDTIIINLRDATLDFDVPLGRDLFAGTNSAPTGTEGTADDLKGQFKPVVYGRARQVPAPVVNGSRAVLQVHDGQIEDIDAARDQGVALSKGASRAFADIDNATQPTAGYYDYHLGGASSGAYARLVSTETRVGPFTFDVKGDKRGGTYRTTAADIAHEIAGQRTDTAPALVTADATSLNAAAAGICGLFNRDNLTVRQAFDALMPAALGKWWIDELGRFRLGRLAAPSGTPAMNFVRLAAVTTTRGAADADILRWSLDPAAVPVIWRASVNYRRFWHVQTDGLSANILGTLRAQLQHEWRSVTASDAGVLTQYPGAAEITIDSALDDEADAQALADAVLALFKVRRDTVRLTAQLDAATYALAPMLAQVKSYGILDYGTTGRSQVVLGRSLYDAKAGTAEFVLWG